MENNKLTALIIDDHPLISEAYKSAFQYVQSTDASYVFDIHVKHNCDDAHAIIQEFATEKKTLMSSF